jgi:hypothetical protein
MIPAAAFQTAYDHHELACPIHDHGISRKADFAG